MLICWGVGMDGESGAETGAGVDLEEIASSRHAQGRAASRNDGGGRPWEINFCWLQHPALPV